MTGMGRMQPADATARFLPWQPAMLGRTTGFGQIRPVGNHIANRSYFENVAAISKSHNDADDANRCRFKAPMK